jgi:hypothetical protein
MLHHSVFLSRAGDRCGCDFCLLTPGERAKHKIVHISPNTFLAPDAAPLPSSAAPPPKPQRRDPLEGFVCARGVVGFCAIS